MPTYSEDVNVINMALLPVTLADNGDIRLRHLV